jgi:hypothetical protein
MQGYNSYPYIQNSMQYQQGMMNQMQSPNFTQPTIHAEIVQISGDIAEAESYPVPTGGTQMMINKAEDKIFIKTVYANNQSNVDVFVKQAPIPEKPQPDFDSFVTKEELEQRLSQIMSSQTSSRKKKEETASE